MTGSKAPLEDIMVAMDVVDTLRHQQDIANRELDTQGRRERLLSRLRDMYQSQGIEVPDSVLLEGIDALEQERFKYVPVARSWKTKVAQLWVSRTRWGRPIGLLGVIAGLLWGIYFALEVLPDRQLKATLPLEIERTLQSIQRVSKVDEVTVQAQSIAHSGKQSIKLDKLEEASIALSQLNDMREMLISIYKVRVVSRPNENSGIWRVPPNNSNARNYYLIVEAIDANGRVLALPILNEENNTRKRVSTWGLRVNEETFYAIASDKQDDGIIQNNIVGIKNNGFILPDFSVATTGATITEW